MKRGEKKKSARKGRKGSNVEGEVKQTRKARRKLRDDGCNKKPMLA